MLIVGKGSNSCSWRVSSILEGTDGKVGIAAAVVFCLVGHDTMESVDGLIT